MNSIFFNYSLNKNKLKTLLLWCIINYGQYDMLNLAENLKEIGFHYATKAGISLGVDDLKTISSKYDLILRTKNEILEINNSFEIGKINEVEQSQLLIENWQKISEILKQDIVKQFQTVNKLNPIYMMAFSGARGNISQVRQLIGMRGLMADPNGQIIHLPIKSNFREGLTVTEYLISCYGARKGVVDTALRTATAGYLTRRLVDCVQHVIVSQLDCGTKKGITLTNLLQNGNVLFSLNDQLYGRILASDLVSINNKRLKRNTQIDKNISKFLSKNFKRVFVRSILNCYAPNLTACQLCYGWNLSHSKLVSLGDVIGIIAAQSIGEPGTQLTMRTFHTGGVFSGSVVGQIYAPFDGKVKYSSTIKGNIIHTYQRNLAFLVKQKGSIILFPLKDQYASSQNFQKLKANPPKRFSVNPYTILFIRNKERVKRKQLIAYLSDKNTNIQEIETQYIVNSKIEGEISFQKSLSYFKGKQIKKIKGKIWILYGKIYKSLVPLQLYPKTGDLIYKNFPLAKINLLNPGPSFLRSLIVKQKNIKTLKKRFQKTNLSLFSETILFQFLLQKIINRRFSSLFITKTSANIENQQTLRVENSTIIDSMRFFVPLFSSILKNNAFCKNNQTEFFKKDFKTTNFREYSEKIISKSYFDSFSWLPSYFFLKGSAVFFYESFLYNNLYNKISNTSSNYNFDSKKEKKYIQNYKADTFSKINKNFSKERLFLIEKGFANFYLKTSFSSKKKHLNIFDTNIKNSFLVQSKKLLFYPKTHQRIQFNSYFIKILNSHNKNKTTFDFFSKPNSFNLFLKPFCKKIDLSSLQKQNDIFSLKQGNFLNHFSFYILPNVFRSFKHLNFLNLSFFFKNLASFNFKFSYSLLELIKSFELMMKYKEKLSYFQSFYKNKKIHYFLKKNQSIILFDLYKNDYFYFLHNKNKIQINNIPSNFFDSHKFFLYSVKNKNSFCLNNSTFFTNLLPSSFSFSSQQDKNLNLSFSYLIGALNIKGILYLSDKSNINSLKVSTKNFLSFKNKKVDILFRCIKDYFSIKYRNPFWTRIEREFNEKFFLITRKKNLLFSELLFENVINRKLKNYNLGQLLNGITFINKEFSYFSLNLIKEYPLFLDTNYYKFLGNHKKTISNIILDYREKDKILNTFHSPSNVHLFSLKSPIF